MLPFIERATASVTFDPTLGMNLRQQIAAFLPTLGFEVGNIYRVGTAERIAWSTARRIDAQVRLGNAPTIPEFEQGQLPEGLFDWVQSVLTPVTEVP